MKNPNSLYVGDSREYLGYTYLGAVGPSLGDFIANGDDGLDVPNSSAYWAIWDLLFGFIFGYDGNTALIDDMGTIQAGISAMHDALAAMDTGLLKDWSPMPQAALNLNTTANTLGPDVIAGIGQAIMDTVSVKPWSGGSVPPPTAWEVRDIMHWLRTGTFVSGLREAAAKQGPMAQAYADGYLTSYAGKTCGSPFINSIAGGPYRTTWWRNRYIANWVDAWVWGYYNPDTPPDMKGGDDPVPPYDAWRDLGNATPGKDARVQQPPGLHTQMSLAMGPTNAYKKPDDDDPGNPDRNALDPHKVMAYLRGKDRGGKDLDPSLLLPADFCKYWFQAFHDAYGDDYTPPSISNNLGGDDHRRQVILTHAFLRLWLVLWFQTGTGLQGLGLPPKTPDGVPLCSDKPVWDDLGNVQGQGSAANPNPPPIPQREQQPDSKTVCGFIAALLGAAAYLTRELFLGGGAIAAFVDAVLTDPSHYNWDQLQCALYWYEWYYAGFCHVLHSFLVKAGFAFPWPSELRETMFTTDPTQPVLTQMHLGREMIRSKAQFKNNNNYPMNPPANDLDIAYWLSYPTTGVENKPTDGFLNDRMYPSFFVDDPAYSGDITQSGGPYDESNPVEDSGGLAAPTGNAVHNIVKLLQGDSFPRWNLDADRGMSFWTWLFQGAYNAENIKAVDLKP
jgi:hypothetical protein